MSVGSSVKKGFKNTFKGLGSTMKGMLKPELLKINAFTGEVLSTGAMSATADVGYLAQGLIGLRKGAFKAAKAFRALSTTMKVMTSTTLVVTPTSVT